MLTHFVDDLSYVSCSQGKILEKANDSSIGGCINLFVIIRKL